MSICLISSDRSDHLKCGRGAFRVLLPLALLLLTAMGGAEAQQLITQEEALELAFPNASEIQRRTAYLTAEQLSAAARLAGRGVEMDHAAVVTYYVGFRGDRPLGVAYFDSHRVRTLPEVLMIVVSPGGTVDRIEVLQFAEPPEYRPPARWLELFEDEALSNDLMLRRDIPNMTGASLTSDAVTDAVRRSLALHQVIEPLRSTGRSGK